MSPMFLAIIAVQVLLVVHVLKSGKDRWWVLILIFAPIVGSLAYLIVEIFPNYVGSSSGSSGGYQSLVRKCGGSWATADRLIQVEKKKRPEASREQCIANAIYRLDRDRR